MWFAVLSLSRLASSLYPSTSFLSLFTSSSPPTGHHLLCVNVADVLERRVPKVHTVRVRKCCSARPLWHMKCINQRESRQLGCCFQEARRSRTSDCGTLNHVWSDRAKAESPCRSLLTNWVFFKREGTVRSLRWRPGSSDIDYPSVSYVLTVITVWLRTHRGYSHCSDFLVKLLAGKERWKPHQTSLTAWWMWGVSSGVQQEQKVIWLNSKMCVCYFLYFHMNESCHVNKVEQTISQHEP